MSDILLDSIVEKWKKFCFGGETTLDLERAKKGFEFFYKTCNLPLPDRVEVVDNPKAAFLLAESLGDTTTSRVDFIGCGFDADWCVVYEYKRQQENFFDEEAQAIYDISTSGVFDCLCYKELLILIRRPLKVMLDSRDRLHCETGPAFVFLGDVGVYFWHNTSVPEKLILHPELITKKDIEDEKNSEVVRAMAEKLGWGRFLSLLDVVEVDKWVDPKTSLTYLLYDEKNRKFELAPKYLKMQSPPLNDGSQPFYVEPVHPGLILAQAARKWKLAEPVFEKPDVFILDGKEMPGVETVGYCNANPEFIVDVEA